MRTDSKPWYRQFWPWFIIAIPGSSVVVGMILLHAAINTDDTLVREEWYKDGKAINQRLDKQNLARTLGLKARFSFTPDENIVLLQVDNLETSQEATLTLDLVHPTLATRDIRAELFRTPDNTYFAKLERSPAGFYYAQIRSEKAGWEIDGQVNFNNPLTNVALN